MISLRSTPFPIDFAGNNPRFDIKAQPYAVPGKSWTASIRIYAIPYVAGFTNTIILQTPQTTISRNIIPSNGASLSPLDIKETNDTDTIADRLLDRLCNEAELLKYYRFEVWAGVDEDENPCCWMKITARNEGSGFWALLSYQQDGQSAMFNGRNVIQYSSFIEGVDPQPYSGHIVKGRFLVNRQVDRRDHYLDNLADRENLETPEFAIWVTNGNATIDTRLLRSYFHRMDIPHYGEVFGVYPVSYNTIRYRLRFSEHNESTETEYTRTSQEFLLVNGILQWNRQIENLPDWGFHADDNISQSQKLITWGTPQECTRRVFDGCELYIYVANFTASARAAAITILCGSVVDLETLIIPSRTIGRIPIGTNALPAGVCPSSVGAYTVSIMDGHEEIASVKVELIPKPYHARVLLLQSHLGIAETFIIEEIVFERETAGSSVVIDGERDAELSESRTLLTLRTGYKDACDMRLLADAYTRTDNYLFSDTLAYRINFVPGTLTVIDEGEDLQSAEVQITLGKPIERKLEEKENPYMEDADHIGDGVVLIDPYEKVEEAEEAEHPTKP